MSAAIRAKTAKERAAIAVRKIKAEQTDSRTFGDCFEMGDGDEVYKLVWDRVRKNPGLFLLVQKALVIPDDLKGKSCALSSLTEPDSTSRLVCRCQLYVGTGGAL